MKTFMEWLCEAVELKDRQSAVDFINKVAVRLGSVYKTDPSNILRVGDFKDKYNYGGRTGIYIYKAFLGDRAAEWLKWIAQQLRANDIDVGDMEETPSEIRLTITDPMTSSHSDYTGKVFDDYEGGNQGVVYHALPSKYVPLVTKEGIKPASFSRVSKGTNDVYHSLGRIFFSSDPRSAKQWIDNLQRYRDDNQDYSIIAIDLNKAGIKQEDLKWDQISGNKLSFYVANKPIPASAIKVIPTEKI